MIKKDLKKGFTLIELLVVVAIIGILSSVVLSSLNGARSKARDAKRVSDLKQLQLALEMYYDSNSSSYPAAISSLVGDEIPVQPTDPTGGNYLYLQLNSGTGYHLGANLETPSHPALATDNDLSSASVITDGADDDSCTGTAGLYCYDLSQ